MSAMFGYKRSELEGLNVSALMPQPFGQRHAQFMSRYVSTGAPHIMDSHREMVGLHKVSGCRDSACSPSVQAAHGGAPRTHTLAALHCDCSE